MSRNLLIATLFGVFACGFVRADDGIDVRALAAAYSDAFNRQDIEAVLSFWSEDAELTELPGGDGRTQSGIEELRASYERLFSLEFHLPMAITVKDYERVGDQIREWGTYSWGEYQGCYVLIRRKSDEWKIYREWTVMPCSE